MEKCNNLESSKRVEGSLVYCSQISAKSSLSSAGSMRSYKIKNSVKKFAFSLEFECSKM